MFRPPLPNRWSGESDLPSPECRKILFPLGVSRLVQGVAVPRPGVGTRSARGAVWGPPGSPGRSSGPSGEAAAGAAICGCGGFAAGLE